MNINENFRYLHIGLPNDVLRRKLHGDFEGAVAAIDRHLASPTTPEALKRCLTVQRELILRLPLDYPYPKEEALALVREHIPDFTEAEFDALEDQWKIDWIYDHGVPTTSTVSLKRFARPTRPLPPGRASGPPERTGKIPKAVWTGLQINSAQRELPPAVCAAGLLSR